MNVQERFQEIVRAVFDDETLVVTDISTAEDIPGWDSLTHINIIVAVEKTFDVRFAAAEIAGLKQEGQNVGRFLSLISRKMSKA